MVGQFSRECGMRKLVRIDIGFDERGCLFPNGIVAGHENNAAPHQRRNRIILAGEGPRRVLIVGGIGSRSFRLDDRRIGLELSLRPVWSADTCPTWPDRGAQDAPYHAS